MSEEERHPSKYLREKGTVDFCYKCGQAKAPGCVCIYCGTEEVEEDPGTCPHCGGLRRLPDLDCPSCEEQKELFAEERRRGVRESEEEPTWQRRVLVLLDEAFPSVYQALLVCRDEDLIWDLCQVLQEMRRAQIRVEVEP